jgi:transcriptional regulator with XRE-family HTH domain
VTAEQAPRRRGRGKARSLNPGWSQHQLAVILGIERSVISRLSNGLLYPNVAHMKKFEAVLGWPAREQIDLLPMVLSDPDLRWSTVFNEVLREWMDANPRTAASDDLVVLARTRKPAGRRPGKV